jgi:hypothetical protein
MNFRCPYFTTLPIFHHFTMAAPVDERLKPEDFIPGVIFSPEGTTLSLEDKEKLRKVQIDHNGEPEQLCRACGWNKYNELVSSYLPRLRVMYTRLNGGLWKMGTKYVIWDRATEERTGGVSDYKTWKFLRERETRNIPLVEEMHHFGKPEDQFQFTVMSQAKGVPLREVLPSLSPEEKHGIAQQITAALRELRQFTAPFPQCVDGTPLWDNIIGSCDVGTCKKIGKTKEDWLNSLAEELRYGLSRRLETDDKKIIDVELQNLKDNFPAGGPYVLTHGDLHFANIMYHEGKITAIIDWETAGYYPWWAERWITRLRAYSVAEDDVLDTVWAELDKDYGEQKFLREICKPVAAAVSAWNRADLSHTEDFDFWFRPPFCECKPYGGLIRKKVWGAELKHEIGFKDKTWERGYP